MRHANTSQLCKEESAKPAFSPHRTHVGHVPVCAGHSPPHTPVFLLLVFFSTFHWSMFGDFMDSAELLSLLKSNISDKLTETPFTLNLLSFSCLL